MSTGSTTNHPTVAKHDATAAVDQRRRAAKLRLCAKRRATSPCSNTRGKWSPIPARRCNRLGTRRRSGGNAGQSQYDAAQAGYLGVMGQTPQQVTPGQLSSTNLQPYMNPYTQNVINSTLPIMQQNLALSQNQNQNAGQRGQRLRRLAPGRSTGRDAGARRAGHGADGGAVEPGQLWPGAERRAKRHRHRTYKASSPTSRRSRTRPASIYRLRSGLGALGNAAQANQFKISASK